MHKSIYKLNRSIIPEQNLSLDPSIIKLADSVKTWQKLKKHKVPDHEIANITSMSRASFYRSKKALELFGLKGLERRSKKPKTFRKSKIPESTKSLILKLRHENPTYGKSKIVILLKRDHGIAISESTAGRIISGFLKEGKISKSASAAKVKRKRKFTSHARRWEYGMKAKEPGELVQIDHMTVTKHNITMKEFRAWDPITKIVIADVVSNATSYAAAKFLNKVMKELPFKVKSVQVDGGSEFMKNFESECAKHKIPLFVLPPSRPQWNGGVERANRTFREEFYTRNDIRAESIGEFKYELQKAVKKYNTYRPHFSLKGMTPYEYSERILAA